MVDQPEQSQPARVSPHHPLAASTPQARLGFRAALAARGIFSARRAWSRALATDDATLACDLARHGWIPPSAGSHHEDWLCHLLRKSLRVRRADDQPLARDPDSGLSVTGAILAAGANPCAGPHAADGNGSTLGMAIRAGRLPEAASMLAYGAACKDCLDDLLHSHGHGLDTKAWAVAQGEDPDEYDTDDEVPPEVRWKAFLELLAAIPVGQEQAAFSSTALADFARSSGLRAAVEVALREGAIDSVEPLLVHEAVHEARPGVLAMLQEMAHSHAAADATLPQGTPLLRALADYEGFGKVSDFLTAIAGLAASEGAAGRSLDDVDDCGNTASHILARNAHLAREEQLPQAFAVLRSTGLPNQSLRLNAKGQTPMQCMEEVALSEDWHLSTWNAAKACLLSLEQEARLAPPVPVQESPPRRRRPRA